MKNPTNNSETTIDRRSVLKSTAIATGMGIVGVSGFTGAVGAEGSSEPCEDCGSLLTKYEWAYDEESEEYKFMWEKGRDSLGIDGDEFDLTVEDTNEDGEPLEFKFDSIDNANGDGIYEATCLTVKAGQETYTREYDWVSTDTFRVDDKYAISNFALCINDAMWQMDFGTNDPPLLNTEDPDTSEGYGNTGEGPRDLIAAAVYGPPNRTGNFSYAPGDVPGVDLISTEFDLEDADGNDVDIGSSNAVTASVTFDVTQSDPLELHLATWEMPGPYFKADIPWGPRYDTVHDWFDPVNNPHTITVDLPTL